MGVDPDDATGQPVSCREPAERPQRDRVVAPEHERDGSGRDRLTDEPGDPSAGLEDLGEVARALVAERGRLLHGGLHVAAVLDLVAKPAKPLFQTRVADRRRSHVDTATPLAEIERGADDRDSPPGHGAAA